jgi:hypothetical protein
MTQKQQIKLFQEIVNIASHNPASQELGEAVVKLLKQNNALEWWDKKINPTAFTKEEQAVIHAVQSGWQFYQVDGVTWYWMNDVRDGNGPWANGGYGTPNLRVVSSRMINKLIACGQFPKNYKFG